MLEVDLTVLPESTVYPWPDSESDKYNATSIAAGGSYGSPCYGDSGGPLFIRNRDGCGGVNYKQIGIVSGGVRVPGRPWTGCDGIAQFTRLNQFNDWIEDTLRGYNDDSKYIVGQETNIIRG